MPEQKPNRESGSIPCRSCGREQDYDKCRAADGQFFCSNICRARYVINKAKAESLDRLNASLGALLFALIRIISSITAASAAIVKISINAALSAAFMAFWGTGKITSIAASFVKFLVILSLRILRAFIRIAAEAVIETYKYLYCEYIRLRPLAKKLLRELWRALIAFIANTAAFTRSETRVLTRSLREGLSELKDAPVFESIALTSAAVVLAAYYISLPSVQEKKLLTKYQTTGTSTFETISEDTISKRLKPPEAAVIKQEIIKPKPAKQEITRPVIVSIPLPSIAYTEIIPPPEIKLSKHEPTVTYSPVETIVLPSPPKPEVKTTASVVLPKPPDILPPKAFPLPPPDVLRGSTSVKRIVITFDGGSEDSGAATILDTLKANGIRTTIFLTGEFIKRYPESVRRMVAEGHEIGNHTLTHPHLTEYENTRKHDTLQGVSKEFLKNELLETARVFKMVTGTTMAPLWRAPYGEVNAEIRAWAYEAGFIHIGWTSNPAKKESLDTLDWVTDKSSRLYRTSVEIQERILSFGKDSEGLNGGIILMHLGSSRKDDRAEDGLNGIITVLKGRGYEFVKITALLNGIPPIRPYLDAEKLYAMERVLIP